MSEDLSERAIYLLDQAVQPVFRQYGLTQLYGPADRYGVIEWAANVPDLTAFKGFIDTSGVTLDISLAAWHPADFHEEFAANAQVTLGARSGRYFTRWHFTPVILSNLADRADCEQVLYDAVNEVYTSQRTLSAIQSVVSPDDAPSDMAVLPIPEESVASCLSKPRVATKPLEPGPGLTDVDMVNHPPHYRAHASGLEAIEVTRLMGFDLGNATKYVWRADHKNGKRDLEKAKWYLHDAMRHYVGHGTIPEVLLLRVAAAEQQGSLRRAFFSALARGQLGDALDALNEMIDWEP